MVVVAGNRMEWLAALPFSTDRARFTLLLLLALDLTGCVSSDAPLAHDRPAMVRFGSARGYWPSLCAPQISDLSADGVSHLAAGPLSDCDIGASLAARRDANQLGTGDHSRIPWSVCPPFVS
jgi:hypothetical protein